MSRGLHIISPKSLLAQFLSPKDNKSIFDYDDERPDSIPEEENHEVEEEIEYDEGEDEEIRQADLNSTTNSNSTEGILLLY